MPGIRNRVRGPSLIIDSQANGNNVELSTETENRTTESIVRNVISLRSKVFSRANSLDSCNAFPCLPKQAATPKVGSIFICLFSPSEFIYSLFSHLGCLSMSHFAFRL